MRRGGEDGELKRRGGPGWRGGRGLRKGPGVEEKGGKREGGIRGWKWGGRITDSSSHQAV